MNMNVSTTPSPQLLENFESAKKELTKLPLLGPAQIGRAHV